MFSFQIASFVLVMTRLGALIAVAPIFSSPNIPSRLRVAIAALGSVLIAPGVVAPDLSSTTFLTLVGLLAREAGVGLVAGMAARLAFFALEFCGGLIAMEMGLNLAGTVNPFTKDRSETITLALQGLGFVLFLTLDMHHYVLSAVQQSYRIVPIGAAGLATSLLWDFVSRTTAIFQLGLLMAAPLLTVTLLVGLLLAVLGRAVPQMNVFAESFTFRTLAGLSMMGLTLNLLAQHISNAFRRLPEDLLNVFGLLAS
jgi:flagellar biosynthesis protein FliR